MASTLPPYQYTPPFPKTPELQLPPVDAAAIAGLCTMKIDELLRQYLSKKVSIQYWSINLKTGDKFYSNLNGEVKYVGGGIILIEGSLDKRMFSVHHNNLVIMKEAKP